MNIYVETLGSFWWPRFGTDAAGNILPGKTAWFNTTGFPRGQAGTHWKRSWRTPGLVRINMGAFRDATLRPDLLHRVCQTPGLETYQAMNRLLIASPAPGISSIDAILICLHSDFIGRVNFRSRWKSPGVRLVCASVSDDAQVQEILVLLPPEGRITTDEGVWTVAWRGPSGRERPQLVPDNGQSGGELARSTQDFAESQEAGAAK